MQFSLVHSQADHHTSIDISRVLFSTLPNLIRNRPMIASFNDFNSIPESTDHFINAPEKPTVPKSIFAALDTPFRFNWKASAFNQFKKNHNIGVFTLPFPKSDLPESARIF